MKYTVDSIEEGKAVLEKNNEQVIIDIEKLPANVREGSILQYDGDKFIFLTDETNARREQIYKKQQRLFGQKTSD
ncbi:MAG: DUF3006 domain-containing protein [Clostridia bacterium]|nr:DUF3006 domain-containing protein [Clostridia bacterium]